MTLEIRSGLVHGLLGENGAGKSTLMEILYGMIPPDSGRILVDGKPVTIRSPRDALALGIGMVHQHFMLVPGLTVLENLILGNAPVRGPFIDFGSARRRVEELAAGSGLHLDLDRPARDLSPGEQQKVEILKLLHRNARVLILDEPTAVLPPPDVTRLLAELRRLAAGGRAVILITHKLREVMTGTDQVSVLRQGRLISSRPTAETGVEELAREIVGTLEVETGAGRGRALPDATKAPLLELQNVTVPGPDGRCGLNSLSLAVHSGQILAVAGVEGNGSSELARLLSGRLEPCGGSILFSGERIPEGHGLPIDPGRIGYIPEDRHRDALVLPMSLERNLLLGRQRQDRFRRGPVIDRAAVSRHAAGLVERHDVRPANPCLPAAAFSGGNQQKAVVAREVEETPPLLVAAHPTRGLDLKATRAVHDHLRRLRDRGSAVVVLTAELDEARALADRLVVLFEGRLAGEVDPASAGEEEIGLLMTGGHG